MFLQNIDVFLLKNRRLFDQRQVFDKKHMFGQKNTTTFWSNIELVPRAIGEKIKIGPKIWKKYKTALLQKYKKYNIFTCFFTLVKLSVIEPQKLPILQHVLLFFWVFFVRWNDDISTHTAFFWSESVVCNW